jgi:hypothetical protein
MCGFFLPLQMWSSFNHQQATQCIPADDRRAPGGKARPQWTMGQQLLTVV